MSLPQFAVRNPVLIHLMVLLVTIAGLFAYRTMPKDQFPDVALAAMAITTVMPGASPKEIEQLITIPIEEELAKLEDLDSMQSGSSEGISTIFVEFDTDTDQNFEKLTEVQNKINQVPRFPEDAERPVVAIAKPPFFTATVAILGTAPEGEIKDFAENLEDALRNLDGVAEVLVSGVREREIWIEVEPSRLYTYGLSLADISVALRQRNLNLPGGLIRMDRGEFAVRTEAEYQDLQQIHETILREGENGYVYLSDVASVSDTFENRRSLARLDGEPSVNLVINKDKKSNTITLLDEVREVVARFEAQLPAGTYMKIVDDTSIEIKNRLRALYSNLAIGLMLVVLSISLFIGKRAAIMVAAGIPVAFLATFVLIQAYGLSVNTLVLFGLILVIGLVVDDAIVVCENVYRHYESGLPIAQAAIKGTEQIIWPVTATVATTVAAFLPLLLMGGILGQFMEVIPIVVTFALVASLGEAFLILPVHISEWGGVGVHRGIEHARPWFHRAQAHYKRLLHVLLRRRYLAVLAVSAMAVFTLWLAAFRMDFVLFGGRDLASFSVAMEAPPGATIEETDRIVRAIEDRTLEITGRTGEADSIRTEIGSLRRGASVSSTSGTHVAMVTVDLVDFTERSRTGSEIKEEVRASLVDLTGTRSLNIEESVEGPPVGKPVQVRVVGANFDVLREIADEVKAHLRGIEGVKDVIDNFPPGKDEVRPHLDLEKIAALGLDVQTIATEIRGAFDGIEATRVYDGHDEIEVMVKYSQAHRESLSNLADMQFATAAGMVPFTNIARLERQEGVAEISHYFQDRSINVTADVVPGVTTSTRVNQALMRELSDVSERYPGYSLTFGGEFEDTQESVASMFRAFIVSIVLIYVILGGLFKSFFQPLIVMFSVPFAFIGVVVGFYLLNEPLGMFSIIGTIALAGIVVNDSLILIDFINRKRGEGLGEIESIIEASAMRLRPIMLTSLTTILGLLPMAIGLFGVDEFLKPMAISIAWGLAFSTILCLGMIPCVYRIFDDISKRLVKRPLSMNNDPLASAPADTEAVPSHLPDGALS